MAEVVRIAVTLKKITRYLRGAAGLMSAGGIASGIATFMAGDKSPLYA